MWKMLWLSGRCCGKVEDVVAKWKKLWLSGRSCGYVKEVVAKWKMWQLCGYVESCCGDNLAK